MIPSKLNTSLRSKNKVLENIDLKGFLTEHWLIAFVLRSVDCSTAALPFKFTFFFWHMKFFNLFFIPF